MSTPFARLALTAIAVLAASSPALADTTLSALQPVQGGCNWLRVSATQRQVVAKLPLKAADTSVAWSPNGRDVAFWEASQGKLFYSEDGRTPIALPWGSDRQINHLGFDRHNRLVVHATTNAKLVGHAMRFEGHSYATKVPASQQPALVQALRYTNGKWQVVESLVSPETGGDFEEAGDQTWALRTEIMAAEPGQAFDGQNCTPADEQLNAQLARATHSNQVAAWLLLPTPYGPVVSRSGDDDDHFSLAGALYWMPAHGPLVKICAESKAARWQVHRLGSALLATVPGEAVLYDLSAQRMVTHLKDLQDVTLWPTAEK